MKMLASTSTAEERIFAGLEVCRKRHLCHNSTLVQQKRKEGSEELPYQEATQTETAYRLGWFYLGLLYFLSISRAKATKLGK